MPSNLSRTLQETIDRESVALRALAEAGTGTRPAGGGWSQKDELGHLIDSAANNHIRFVRGALEPEFAGPSYEAEDWVRIHGYNEMPWTALVDFWQRYNSLLARIVERIPEDRLGTPCRIGEHPAATLGFIISDYVVHMQHHLDHIVQREKVTEYPPAAAKTA